MKNHYRNLLIVVAVLSFSAFALTGENADAQTKPAVKKTPTPKASPKATPKAAAKATPKVSTKATPAKSPVAKSSPAKTPKPAPKKQVIVNVTAARVRSEPNLQSETLRYADIGTVFTVSEQNKDWSKVELSADRNGWISKTITENYSTANKTKIYESFADKYLARKNTDFKTAADVFYFLKKASAETDSAELEFKRLKLLAKILRLIPVEKSNENQYKNFTVKNEDEIVFSEPSGEWSVRSQILWQLHARHKNKPIGEDIAWYAAQIPLPGECEGYINCYVYKLRVTEGEYLNFYPAGKHSREALLNITNFLEPINQDSDERAIYTGPYDISDRAEFNKYLSELRTIVSKTPYVEKQKTINQINRIAEAFK